MGGLEQHRQTPFGRAKEMTAIYCKDSDAAEP